MKKNSFFGLFVLKVIAILFLNGCQNSREQVDFLITRSIHSMAEQQAERMAGRINNDLRVLKTLSNIMGEYENVPVVERRARFDDMLSSVLRSEQNIVTIYTVWKPNAIDGMDVRYIGRTGSSPTGQYAIAYSRDWVTYRIEAKTFEEINKVMEHIHGPYAQQVSVDNPAPLTAYGKDTYVINMMVPIVNPATREVVGGVGFFWDVKIIQHVIEKTVKNYGEIAAMAVYSDNGTIIGSIFPERTGKMLYDADVTLYGDNIRPAYNAVQEGKYYNFKSFVPFLENDVEIIIVPFSIGVGIWENSLYISGVELSAGIGSHNWFDTTWAIMIASPTKLWTE